MKKKSFDPFKNLKLDRYEQEIEDAISFGRVHKVVDIEKLRKKYAQYAKYTKELTKKDKRVNIRMNEIDLSVIQNKASENGLPYQTLINTILHQYAKGKIKVEL